LHRPQGAAPYLTLRDRRINSAAPSATSDKADGSGMMFDGEGTIPLAVSPWLMIVPVVHVGMLMLE
jgi:hypothetical protein